MIEDKATLEAPEIPRLIVRYRRNCTPVDESSTKALHVEVEESLYLVLHPPTEGEKMEYA